MDYVIKEGLRLLGPAVYTIRHCPETTELDGYEIPAGSMVLNSPYVSHRIPEVFANPQRFDPSRWEHIQPSPYEYLPFGAGPRMCLGAKSAMATMKVVLPMILQRYRLSVVPQTRIDRIVNITMYPKKGLAVTVHPQDGIFRASPMSGNVLEMVDFDDVE